MSENATKRELEVHRTSAERMLDFYKTDDPFICLEQAGDGDEPEERLVGIGQLKRMLDELEDQAVLAARVEAKSWQYIGTLLQRSRQAVWEKHRDPQDEGPNEV